MSGGQTAEKLLVLMLDENPDLAGLREELGRREDARVRLVVPAQVGLLDWYATDEDGAREQAESRARDGQRAIARVAEAEAAAGDLDPVLSVQDALSEFPADRILIVGESDAALESSLRRFNLPIARLDQGPEQAASSEEELREKGRAIMSGRSDTTPFMVFGGTIFVLGAFVATGLVLAALVLWVF